MTALLRTEGIKKAYGGVQALNGATIVNWYGASAGHDACKSSGTRWVEPLIPGEIAFPVHPNKAGMAGGAAALEAAIG